MGLFGLNDFLVSDDCWIVISETIIPLDYDSTPILTSIPVFAFARMDHWNYIDLEAVNNKGYCNYCLADSN